MEGVGEDLDELAEIHTLIGDVIENRLVAVALVFHVANLHLQSEVFGNLPALDHRVMLAGLSLLAFLDVDGLGDAIHTLDLVHRLEVRLLHLEFHQSAGERHHTDVMSGVRLHGNHIALLQVEVVHIVVISLSGVLELHLHEVGAFIVSRNVGKPVVGVQLSVLPSHGTATESSVTAMAHSEFHILVIHLFQC